MNIQKKTIVKKYFVQCIEPEIVHFWNDSIYTSPARNSVVAVILAHSRIVPLFIFIISLKKILFIHIIDLA